MAKKKISKFGSATLPLTGNESVTLIQNGNNKNCKVSDLATVSRVLCSVKAGTSEATAAGIAVGANTYTNDSLSGGKASVMRGGLEIPDFDMGDGSTYFTLSGTTITFSDDIEVDEWIKIKLE